MESCRWVQRLGVTALEQKYSLYHKILQSGRLLPTFRGDVRPPFSGYKFLWSSGLWHVSD
jgi:hypothetical protein